MNVTVGTKDFLKDLPFFSDISEKNMQLFIESMNIKSYKKGQNLFFRGDTADRFFIVKDGWLKLHRETQEGDETVITILTRGDILGKSIVFSKSDYQYSAQAVEDSSVIEIPASVLKDVIFNDKAMVEHMMIFMAREVRQMQIETEHLALMSAAQRVACLLLKLSRKINGKGGDFDFPYDKSLGASLLGMKPETFSRALSQLKEVGVMVKGSVVNIDSFERLHTYCCRHCSALPVECSGYRGKFCKNKICACLQRAQQNLGLIS